MEAKAFKRQAEIELQKQRPCDAKRPDTPEWHCGVGGAIQLMPLLVSAATINAKQRKQTEERFCHTIRF